MTQMIVKIFDVYNRHTHRAMTPTIMRAPAYVVHERQQVDNVICQSYQSEIIEKIRITSYYNALEKNC